MIQWLNKQLTNAKVRDPGFRIAPPPKNLSLGMGDISMTTMQPSMATEQKNNKMVASTPIQNQDNQMLLNNENGKENKIDGKNTEKSQLDPKYLQPSRNRAGLHKPNENCALRKNSPSTSKQQSVYFS